MDKKYITLFKDLAQVTATSAETVMDYNRQQGDDKGLKTAQIMRDDFQSLTETIKDAGDAYVLTQPDAARLLVGAMVVVNQLQDKVNALRKAITGYQTDVIPKLQRIVDEAGSDNELAKKIVHKFVPKADRQLDKLSERLSSEMLLQSAADMSKADHNAFSRELASTLYEDLFRNLSNKEKKSS